jgi:GLPGLI family protein
MKYTLCILMVLYSSLLIGQNLDVTYLLEYPKDTNNVNQKFTEEFFLSLDKDKSKFRELKSYQKGMMIDSMRKGLINDFEGKSRYKLLESHFNFLLHKTNKEYTYFEDLKGPLYNYEFEKPDFDWAIEDSLKIIKGYKCLKAVSVVKNKKYVAWFTEDIPISNGPYVFGGLPGLILQLECRDRVSYSFTMIGLTKSVQPLVLTKMDRFILKNAKEFIAIKNEFKLAPITFMFKSGMVEGPTSNGLIKKFDDANKAAIEKMKYENFEFDLF